MEQERQIKERIARGNPPEVEAKRQESHKKLPHARGTATEAVQQGANGRANATNIQGHVDRQRLSRSAGPLHPRHISAHHRHPMGHAT